MAKGMKHYYKDGSECTSKVHKMPDGSLHSGATHTKSSKRLYHMDELSKAAQKKAKEGSKKPNKEKKK
tara:strand:+ start:163 stop:366 length:204 start_codon:yes stop_codon:yes gene_type:complete